MPSERIQRQIDGFLDEAEAAMAQGDWALLRDRAEKALRLDPTNADALTYLDAAARDLTQAVGAQGLAPLPSSPQPPPPPDPPPAPTTTSARTHPTSFVNGRYTVIRFLGEGGKKIVYMCHDNVLDRDVAYGQIKMEGLDDVGRQRLRREAQNTGRLGSHPNIVTVYEYGEDNGQPYLVTELMEGGDVEGLIAKAPDHRLPLERIIQIARDVSSGLDTRTPREWSTGT